MYETQVTILGVGERIQGENARGKYDIVNVAFSYPDRKMEGVNCACLVCPGHVADQLMIGDTYRAMLIFRREDKGNGKYNSVLCKVCFL